jgi:hypothetical protein
MYECDNFLYSEPTALTNCSKNVRFEYSVGTIVGIIGGGLSIYPCLLDALGRDTSTRRET